MSLADLNVASPVVVAILTALAILLVDLALPGRTTAALVTALGGLLITAIVTISVGSGVATTVT